MNTRIFYWSLTAALPIAQGFAALGISDEERMGRQFPVYDVLYAYVQGV